MEVYARTCACMQAYLHTHTYIYVLIHTHVHIFSGTPPRKHNSPSRIVPGTVERRLLQVRLMSMCIHLCMYVYEVAADMSIVYVYFCMYVCICAICMHHCAWHCRKEVAAGPSHVYVYFCMYVCICVIYMNYYAWYC